MALQIIVKGYKDSGRDNVAEAVERFLLAARQDQEANVELARILTDEGFSVTTEGIRVTKKVEVVASATLFDETVGKKVS